MRIDEQLTHLETSGLIRLVQVAPELEYLFKHALVQDAAYESLLKQDRRDLHRAVGEALERLYADRKQELAAVLASHFAQADEPARAFDYYMLAGEVASRKYANAETVIHVSHAIGLAERAKATGGQLLSLYARKGRALELDGRYDEAVATYEEMEAAGVKHEDRALELASLMNRATVFSTFTPRFNPDLGDAMTDRALALARELGDREAEVKGLWNKMLICRARLDMEQTIVNGEQALVLARELGLREQTAFILNDISSTYSFIGRLKEGEAAGKEALVTWRELDNRPMQADTLANLSQMYYASGELDSAWEAAQEALAISRSIGNAWGQSYSALYSALIALDWGRIGTALALMRDSIEKATLAGFSYPLIVGRSLMGIVYAWLGNVEEALALVKDATSAATDQMSPFIGVPIYARSEVLLRAGDLTAAREAFEESQATLSPNDSFTAIWMVSTGAALARARGDPEGAIGIVDSLILRYPEGTFTGAFLFDARFQQALALRDMGKLDEAYNLLIEVRDGQTSASVRRSLWQTLAALAEIESERGNTKAADKHRKAAREEIKHISDQTDDPVLRKSFLALPAVEALRKVNPG